MVPVVVLLLNLVLVRVLGWGPGSSVLGTGLLSLTLVPNLVLALLLVLVLLLAWCCIVFGSSRA